MIDDIQDEDEDEGQIVDNQMKIKWYFIDTERTFCKCWDFLITCLTIYNLLVTPLILVFPEIYTSCKIIPNKIGGEVIGLDASDIPQGEQECASGIYEFATPEQRTLKNIELGIDIIYSVEILFCFVKRTMAKRELNTIIKSYIQTYFIFDAVSTIPNMAIFNEGRQFYWLKVFRFVHLNRLHQPLQMLLKCALAKYSKKRQNDLTSFTILILLVIYSSHINACIWLFLGNQEPCPDENELGCIKSWKYANSFDNKPITT